MHERILRRPPRRLGRHLLGSRGKPALGKMNRRFRKAVLGRMAFTLEAFSDIAGMSVLEVRDLLSGAVCSRTVRFAKD